ncbi:phage tail tape measure protein [Listeria monocytogenes]|uniref:Phage tail tape measure protein n=1 Tax=Listeria monocytogenes TaxID=1639 RepID=A0A6C8MXL0_LISMN|nr:phage tail tape measure protein [Listeria monocytogenes]KAA9534137.1 phage tail tape measure protein [Listeria monocytogenes]KAA9541438.1 phage tail tape measure protein [Listeria monocytogenes]
MGPEKLQGLTIAVGMDYTGVNDGAKGLKRQIGLVNAEMKANLSAFGRGEKSLQSYSTELSGLNKKLNVQKRLMNQAKSDYQALEKRNASLNNEMKESNKALQESKKRYEQLQNSGTATTKELKAAEKEVKTNEKAYNNLNKELQDMPKSMTNAQKAVYKETASYNNLQRKVDTTTEAFKKLRREQAIKASPFGKMTQQLDQYQKKLKQTGDKYIEFGKKGAVVAAPVALGLGLATKKAADFEQQMSNTLSVMAPGEVDKYREALRKLAIQQGAKTKYSALEAAEAEEELLKAGLSVKDVINGGLSGALSLATAGELDLGDAAEIAATALNAFKKDNISVAKAADILAGAANASATSVSEMKFSLAQSASVASGVGLSFKDTSTALAVFAQNGLKGSDAGTSLKTMLMRLAPQTDKAWGVFDELGLSVVNTEAAMKTLTDNGVKPLSKDSDVLMDQLRGVAKELAGPKATAKQVEKEFTKLVNSTGSVHSAFYDNNGQLKSMAEISQLLKKSLHGLTDEQRQNRLTTMFGSDAIRGANILYKEGAEGVKNMYGEMKKVTAQDTARIKMDNLKGTIEELNGALETFGISMGSALTPALRGLTSVAENVANWFNKLDDRAQSVIATAGVIAVAIPAAGLAFGFIAKGAAAALTPVKALTAALAKNSVAATENAIVSRADGAAMSTVGKGTKGKGLINGLGNLISFGGKKGAGLKGAAKSADYAKDIANYSKYGKVVGKLGKGVPVLGTALAATQLIGINKKNAGGKIGGTIGGIAGGAGLGAAIGSVVPGVGTLIGGAIGGIAGSKFGQMFGQSVQKHWPAIQKGMTNVWGNMSDWAEKHPILGHPINQMNTVAKMAKKTGNEIKSFFSDPLQTSFSGKGISKGTAKNINAYSKMSQNAVTELKSLEITGDKISKSTSDKISKNFNGMVTLVEKSFDKTKKNSDDNLKSLAKNGLLSSEEVKAAQTTRNRIQKLGLDEIKKNNNKIQSLNKQMANKNKAITQKEAQEINAIRSKAKEKGRALTAAEERQISAIKRRAQKEREASNRLYSNKIQSVAKKQEVAVVSNLSRSAKEQKLILGKLKDSSGKLSAQQASKIVKESKRAKDGAIDQANKKYKGVVKKADEEYYVNGTITKKQHDDIIKKAKDQKNKSIKHATEMHKKVVGQAKKQADGHLKQVDWETGETLSKWDNFKVGLAKAVNWVTGGINKVLKFFGIKEIPPWKPKGSDNDTSSKSKKIDTKRRTSYGSNLAMNYTGSNSASGQIMAGEEGFEIAYNKRQARAQILGANGAEVTKVAPGTKILNHEDSKKMLGGGLGTTLPGFAKGTSNVKDFFGNIGSAVKTTVGKAIDFSEKAFDWVAHPIKNLKNIFSKYSAGIPAMGNDGNLGTQILSSVRDKISDPFKKMLSDVGFGGSVAGPAGGNAKAWGSMIARAAKAMKVDLSGSELKGIIAQIQRESGGNEKITQSSAVVDINTLSGNPARGLLQYIPSTFNAYKVKGHGNIYSGYDQLLAWFNNSNWRRDLPYGKRGWGPSGHRRFANGGLVSKHQLAEVAEGNRKEMIIPLTRKQRAVQLLDKAKQMIGLNDSKVIVQNDNGNIVSILLEMVQSQKEQIQLLAALVNKNSDVYLDKAKVGSLIEKEVTKQQSFRDSRKLRASGQGATN